MSGTTATTDPRRRRSQSERSATTRQALLDADGRMPRRRMATRRRRPAESPSAPASRAARTCITSRRARRSSPRPWSTSPSAAASISWPRRRPCPRAASESRRGSTCSGRAMRALSTRPRWTSGRMPAPTPSCATALLRSSVAWTEKRALVSRELFADLAECDGFERLVEMAAATMRGLALLETLHRGAGATANSGPTAGRGWSGCSRHCPELDGSRGPVPDLGLPDRIGTGFPREHLRTEVAQVGPAKLA